MKVLNANLKVPTIREEIKNSTSST